MESGGWICCECEIEYAVSQKSCFVCGNVGTMTLFTSGTKGTTTSSHRPGSYAATAAVTTPLVTSPYSSSSSPRPYRGGSGGGGLLSPPSPSRTYPLTPTVDHIVGRGSYMSSQRRPDDISTAAHPNTTLTDFGSSLKTTSRILHSMSPEVTKEADQQVYIQSQRRLGGSSNPSRGLPTSSVLDFAPSLLPPPRTPTSVRRNSAGGGGLSPLENLSQIMLNIGENGHARSNDGGGDSNSPEVHNALQLLVDRVETLEVENAGLKANLSSFKVRLSSSLNNEAESTVTGQLADDCIRDLQHHLRHQVSRIDIPNIVIDEFELRCSDLLQERANVILAVGQLLSEHQRLLGQLREKKEIDVIAVDAAVQKNVTVVKLRDEIAGLELKVSTAEAMAKLRTVQRATLAEEVEELKATRETSEILWLQKESQWRAEKIALEKDLSVFRYPKDPFAANILKPPAEH